MELFMNGSTVTYQCNERTVSILTKCKQAVAKINTVHISSIRESVNVNTGYENKHIRGLVAIDEN